MLVGGWLCPFLPAGCPGMEEVATGNAGICPLKFFGQRARRALNFLWAGGQKQAWGCPLRITSIYPTLGKFRSGIDPNF